MAEDVVKEEITKEITELAKAWYNGDFEIGYYNYYICTVTEGLMQDFLLRLRNTPDNHQMDYLVKTFMRIIFKSIHIQNQEIVKFELNEPWKTCYEEGARMDARFRGHDRSEERVKWLKTSEKAEKMAIPEEKRRRSYVCFCAPSDVR